MRKIIDAAKTQETPVFKLLDDRKAFTISARIQKTNGEARRKALELVQLFAPDVEISNDELFTIVDGAMRQICEIDEYANTAPKQIAKPVHF